MQVFFVEKDCFLIRTIWYKMKEHVMIGNWKISIKEIEGKGVRMIFETHAHYDDEAFEEDREALLASMQENGVGAIVNVCADYPSLETVYELSQKYDFIYATVGVHPSMVEELNDEKLAVMYEKARRDKVVAIGEIGLDYYSPTPEPEIQKKWFLAQFKMAKDLDMPVIIHSRDAAADTLQILKSEAAAGLKGIIHCYSYSKEMAMEFEKLGYYFGIGGVVTFRNAKKLVDAVEYLPLERLVLETDSPYLSPEPNRGKRNSSLNIPYIAEKIAEIKKIPYDTVIEVTEKNARDIYLSK